MDSVKRICLWSGPRNISTALMYSFAERPDTKVFDEPLYAHYLANTKAKDYHPGSQEILASMENDGVKVIHNMLTASDSSILFFKHMTHHLIKLPMGFLEKTINLILTRDPAFMLPSFKKQINNPSMVDVGYQAHLDLVAHFKKNNIPFAVIDSKNILLNPEEHLKKLCDFIGISFDKKMLSWSKGPRTEDGCWAPYWYHNVHNSTEFQKYNDEKPEMPESLKPLFLECDKIYQTLLQFAL